MADKNPGLKIAQKIISKIPQAVEKSPFLQNTLSMIMEMQQQAKSIKKDANEEVHKLLDLLQHSYKDIGEQARKAGGDAKKQAKEGVHQLLEKWEAKKGKLPKKFVGEMDNLLKQVGLTGKAKKPAARAKAKTASKAAPKAKAAAKPAAKAKAAPKPKAKAAAATKAKSPTKKLNIKKVVPEAKTLA